MNEMDDIYEADLVADSSEYLEDDTFTEIVAEVVEPERLFLTTSFEDYTVTEGLLFMLLLLSVIVLCVKMLKGGFYWLW